MTHPGWKVFSVGVLLANAILMCVTYPSLFSLVNAYIAGIQTAIVLSYIIGVVE